MLGLESCCRIGSVGEFNIAKPFAPATVAVRDNTNAFQLAKFFELACKPLLVNIPAEIADEKIRYDVGLLVVIIDSGLLRCLIDCFISFTLLATNLFGLWLLLFFVITLTVVLARRSFRRFSCILVRKSASTTFRYLEGNIRRWYQQFP